MTSKNHTIVEVGCVLYWFLQYRFDELVIFLRKTILFKTRVRFKVGRPPTVVGCAQEGATDWFPQTPSTGRKLPDETPSSPQA